MRKKYIIIAIREENDANCDVIVMQMNQLNMYELIYLSIMRDTKSCKINGCLGSIFFIFSVALSDKAAQEIVYITYYLYLL